MQRRPGRRLGWRWPKVEKRKRQGAREGRIKMRVGWAWDGDLAYVKCTLSKVNPKHSHLPHPHSRGSIPPSAPPIILPSFWTYPETKMTSFGFAL